MTSQVVRAVHLELTNSCNLTCLMCPVNRGMKRKREFMDFDLIKKIVKDNPQLKSYALNNWGEPLLHPRFREITQYLTEQGKNFSFATNATLLDEATSEWLVNSNLRHIYFSIDALDKTYEKIRGHPYAPVRDNILTFLDIRKKTGKPVMTEAVATVSEWNLAQIDDLKKEWSPYMKVHLQPRTIFNKKDVRTQECRQLFSRHLVVFSNGTVTVCCPDYEGALAIGNAKDQTLNEILNSERMRQLQSSVAGTFCEYCSEYQSPLTKDRFKTLTTFRKFILRIKANARV